MNLFNLQKIFLVTILGLTLCLLMVSTKYANFDSETTSSALAPHQSEQPKESCREYFNKPNTKPIKEILVVGERHHGTNWIRVIINKNAPLIKCDLNTSHWKHGFFNATSFRLKQNQLLWIVTRDVFAWLPKMYREVYCEEADSSEDLTLPEFIRKEYVCPEKNERAKNLIQLRTAKYKNWIKDSSYFEKPHSCLRTHIKYEDVLEKGQEETVGQVLKDHGIQMNETHSFQRVVGRTTFMGESKQKPPDFYLPNQYTLTWYTIEDICFILDNLDLEFEKNVLNYSYDYVMEYLNNTASAIPQY